MISVALAHVTTAQSVMSGRTVQAATLSFERALASVPPVLVRWLLIVSAAAMAVLFASWAWSRAARRHGRNRGEHRPGPIVYDPVTGLPGRRLFLAIAGQALARAARANHAVAVLIIELSHFKVVTETRGWMNGDVVIRLQAARVKGALRASDTLARLTEDRFAAVLENVESAAQVAATAQKMLDTVGLPLTLEGDEMFMSGRIGYALFPRDAADAAALLDQAERALSMAKADGQQLYPSAGEAASAPEPDPLSRPTASIR